MKSDLFGDEALSQLEEDLPMDDITPCDLIDLRDLPDPNTFLNSQTALPPSLSLDQQSSIFDTPQVSPSYTSTPQRIINQSPKYSPSPTQTNNSPVVQNIQLKNVTLPLQNQTAVIISSESLSQAAQPVVYTSLPIQNQHIILQSNGSQSSKQKSRPVVLQNIQQISSEQIQPVVLQAKIIKSDAQVGNYFFYINPRHVLIILSGEPTDSYVHHCSF